MDDIFISYARDDRSKVEPLAKALNEQGWSVWWDREIEVGDSFEKVIEQAINEAECVIAVWSVKSVNSEWVRAEASEGLRRKILAPVLIEEVEPPLRYRPLHTASLVGWDGSTSHSGFKQLVQALTSILSRPAKSETQNDEKEPPQPDHSTGKAAKEPPPDNNSKPPSNKRLSLGIVAIGMIVILSVIVLFLFLRHKEVTKLESNDKSADASTPAVTKKKTDSASITLQKTFKNSIGIEFVLIPAGSYTMGSKSGIGDSDEGPSHVVKISQPFYLQQTEVTQGQWKKVMGDNPSSFENCGDDCPVETVSWEDAHKFINKLNEMENAEAYRLPTESEWEYAIRAGSATLFSFGDDDKLADNAWFDSNSDSKTHRVGTKKPNAWGLYDMHGNVWEWVEDDGHSNYEGAPSDGSAWIDEPRGTERVMRGGGWGSSARDCRSAYRNSDVPEGRADGVGFRLARSVALDP